MPGTNLVQADGKHFRCGGRRFPFHGITYGTFQPRNDSARFPEPEQAKLDFAAMREAGFTVVRTYTVPPEDVIGLAADWDLRMFAGLFYPDWRYLLGASKHEQRRIAKLAREEAQKVARRLAGNEQIFALSLGNEIPADVVRWIGADFLTGCLEDLSDVVKQEDPDRLVTYGNYPTAEYLRLDCLDFLTFNVFLEQRQDFRSYLTRLQHLAGDRPLVLGEVGSHADGNPGGERRQAQALDWQLEVALERGVAGACIFSWTDEWWVGDAAVTDWRFGLTRVDRSPRPALEVATRWNTRTVADLPFDWPSITVVICAYNAADTLGECLQHTCALSYPRLEIIVVDDGSTDSTARIAASHPRARLVRIPHGGLAVARNEGYAAATGELVAYLDSDAYPSPEWPYYLALGLDGRSVGGVGGPNVVPAGDPPAAQRVAHAPGGPVHVLLSDDRAEHVPGCNMAFWREVLVELGGFDPIYRTAGDDVDLSWRALDRGWQIGFHPAALVWHHRRAGLRPYLRQQRGYGLSEALVEARHRDRFTGAGTARWRGRVYAPSTTSFGRQRIYRGAFGAAAYQSVYRGGGHGLDLVHQLGVPLAVALLPTAAFGLLSWPLALPAVAGLAMLSVVAALDVCRIRPPLHLRGQAVRFRLGVAALYLLQPLARMSGRIRARFLGGSGPAPVDRIKPPVRRLPRGVLLFAEHQPRPRFAAALVAELRRAGIRVASPTGWEDHDARLFGSTFVSADLITSSHPVGFIQMRLRRRWRWPAALCWIGASAVLAAVEGTAGAALLAAGTVEVARGTWRTGGLVRRVVDRASA